MRLFTRHEAKVTSLKLRVFKFAESLYFYLLRFIADELRCRKCTLVIECVAVLTIDVRCRTYQVVCKRNATLHVTADPGPEFPPTIILHKKGQSGISNVRNSAEWKDQALLLWGDTFP